MKPHLLLVHSFPTNSVLLSGLSEFLSDYFTVRLIDLPGFHKNILPFEGTITLKKFSDFVDEKVAELNVSEYIVAGISFGFLVVNNAKLDRRCKAIIAMEPFINTNYLRFSTWEKKQFDIMAMVMKTISSYKLEKSIWNSRWFYNLLIRKVHYPKDKLDVIIKHLDPRTFFSVANLLLNYKKEPKFHDLPYFLMGNIEDKSINFEKTAEVFLENLHELFIISDPIEHFPRDMSKSYFKKKIPVEHISRMLACMEYEEK